MSFGFYPNRQFFQPSLCLFKKVKLNSTTFDERNSMSEIPTLRFSRKPFPSSRFSLQNFWVFVFFKNESNLLYLLSEIEYKFNYKCQFVDAAKEIWKNCKNSRQVTIVADFTNDQTWSHCSRDSTCWAKKSTNFETKSYSPPPPLRTKSTRTCTTSRFFCLWRLECLMSMLPLHHKEHARHSISCRVSSFRNIQEHA